VASKLALRDKALGDSIEADAAASDAAGPGKDPEVAKKLAADAEEKRKAAMAAAEDHQNAVELAKIKNQEIGIRSTDAMRGVATKERDRIESSQSHVGDNLENFKAEAAKEAKAAQQLSAASGRSGAASVAAMENAANQFEALTKRMVMLEERMKNMRPVGY
jgi:hypothetical protein